MSFSDNRYALLVRRHRHIRARDTCPASTEEGIPGAESAADRRSNSPQAGGTRTQRERHSAHGSASVHRQLVSVLHTNQIKSNQIYFSVAGKTTHNVKVYI